MKKKIAWLFLGACLQASAAMAEDQAAGGSVGLGFVTKRLDYNLYTLKVNPTTNALALNGTLFYGRTYASVEHEVQVTGDTAYQFSSGGGVATTNEFDRRDSGLTIGYNIWRGLSIFGGYKYGATQVTSLATSDSQEFTNRASGPFLGLSYGFRIGEGVLGVSIAYANFKAMLEHRFLGPTTTGTDIPSKTTGNSYGISWSAPLTKELHYRLSLKTNRYKFTVNDPNQDVAGVGPPAGAFNSDEKYTIFGISISKQF